MRPTTPKPRSGAFRALYERLTSIFDPSTLRMVALGAFDRNRAEKILARHTQQARRVFAGLPRDELIARLVASFFSKSEVAYEVVRTLDESSRAERSLVASVEPEDVFERLGSLKALRLRRHGAKLVWALARDERETVWPKVSRIVREYMEHAERLDRARLAVREKGAADELREFEELYREAAEQVLQLEEEYSTIEKERARLIATIGQREARLRDEMQRRQQVAQELTRLQQAGQKPQAPPPRAPEQTSAGELKSRVRKLEKRLAAVERERDALEANAERISDLEEENARLRQTVEKLRETRAREHRERNVTSEPVSGAPMVEAPRARRGGKSSNKSSKESRVGIFLDVANLSGAARRLYSRAVDYAALRALLVGNRRVIEARAYTIDKGTEGYDAFAHALREVGYKVLTKKPKTFEDGTMKADWDVGLAVEVLTQREKLDVVILGSGDGDFLPLLSALKRAGVRVEVAAFSARAAIEMRREADQFVELDETVLEAD